MLGISERTFRDWCRRFDGGGEDGLLDRRLGRTSPKRMPPDDEAGRFMHWLGILAAVIGKVPVHMRSVTYCMVKPLVSVVLLTLFQLTIGSPLLSVA